MWKTIATALLVALVVPAAHAEDARKTPYWASISAGKAMMRTGPGKNYPATWLYQRADLPIRVLEVYPSWRKIQDPDGTTGWMLVNLLSDTRTALVTGAEPRPVMQKPDSAAPIAFRVAPGVVGRISKCGDGWCQIKVGKRKGYIRTEHFFGTDRGETLD